MLKNFLNKGDKLPKSKNQILWIKQLNIGNSKFNSLVSHINNGEFLQWKGLRIDKTILHGKRGFTKKKKLHKISLQVWQIIKKTTHVFFAFQQSNLWISQFRPLIDFQNQENTFVVCFQFVIKENKLKGKILFYK